MLLAEHLPLRRSCILLSTNHVIVTQAIAHTCKFSFDNSFNIQAKIGYREIFGFTHR